MFDLILVLAGVALAWMMPLAVRDLKRGIRAAHLLNVIREDE